MKPLTFSTIILLTLSACGQTSKNDKAVSPTNYVARDTTTIYKNISSDFCNCVTSTMRNNKPSTTFDSCYKSVLSKYTDTLKQMGFDPSKKTGELKLSNEVSGKFYFSCHDTYALLQKEWEDADSKKLLFKGELVSQIKLSSGLYKIIMKDNKTLETREFFAKNPLDETLIKKYEAGYELTVEYEVVKNKTTDKDEYFLKESGTVQSVGAVKVSNQ